MSHKTFLLNFSEVFSFVIFIACVNVSAFTSFPYPSTCWVYGTAELSYDANKSF